MREATSLEEVKQLFAELKVKKREINWIDGDTVAIAVDKFGATKETYGQLAETGMGTIKHLQQIERVSRAFPDKEQRDTTYPWSMYRAAYSAAQRTGEDPYEVFLYGVAEGWHTRQFASYGKPEVTEFVFECTCPMCATVFKMKSEQFITETMECPVCQVQGEHTLLPGEWKRKD